MLSFLVYTSVFICLLVYVLAAALPYAVVLLLPRRLSEHCMRALALHMGRLVIYGALRPFVRVRYKDASGGQRPGFYVFNHRAATDAFLVAALGREAIQLVNGWPMRLPFFGFNARRCGYLDTTTTPLEAYPALIGDLLRQGVSVIVFPEGTRSESRRMNAFHSGIFKLAMELKAPIYPCCIAGNERFPDRRFRFHRAREIRISCLPPIQPEAYAEIPSAYVLKKRVQSRIAEEAARLDNLIDGNHAPL